MDRGRGLNDFRESPHNPDGCGHNPKLEQLRWKQHPDRNSIDFTRTITRSDEEAMMFGHTKFVTMVKE